MKSCALSLGSILAALLVVSCGGGHDMTARALEDLRAEVVKLRAEQATLTERLDSLERARRAEPPAVVAQAAPSSPSISRTMADDDRPDLEVVRLRPGEQADVSEEEDAPRPLLRVVGDQGSIQNNPVEGGGDVKKSKSRVARKKP